MSIPISPSPPTADKGAGKGLAASLLAGWSKLVSANAVAAVLQLAAFTVAARALDLTGLGALVLITSFVKLFDVVFNFQSVAVMTRFLAATDLASGNSRFRGLVKAGLLVDGSTALFSCVLAIIALPFAAPLLGLSGDLVAAGQLFCLVILTRIFGVAEAALRCFDHFWLIGMRPALAAGLMLGAGLAAWLQGGGVAIFVLLWLAAEAVANITFMAAAWWTMRGHGLRGIARADARAAIMDCPRFWSMLWHTNLTSALRLISQDGDVLLAGGLFGPAAAGLLRTAKNLAQIINQAGQPLQQVAAAPIARLVASGQIQAAWRHAITIGLVACSASVPLVIGAALFGGVGLDLAFGDGFSAAKWTLVVVLATAALYMIGIALQPLGLALDRGDIGFTATLLGTAGYLLAMAAMAMPLGILGIALAGMVFKIVWLAATWLGVRRELGRRA